MRRFVVSGLGSGLGLGLAAVAIVAPATAADMTPVYKAPPPAVVSGGWYFSADGSWQDVRLPDVALGYRNVSAVGPTTDLGPLDSLRARVDGFGVRGALGYILPQNSYASAWGSNLRIELGGKYVNASGTQNDATTPTQLVGQQLLNGTTTPAAFTCTGGALTCTVGSSLHTDYRTWQLDGKVASDYTIGAARLTPSVAVFGGEGRNEQTLNQAFTQFLGGAILNTGNYGASTALHWNDLGARAGLDASVPLTSWLSVGLGGYVGFAHRDASLSGSDVATSNVGVFAGTSAIAASATTTAFVANVEGGVSIKPWTSHNVTFRLFGGADFDNKVPGISPTSFVGAATAPGGPTSTTPAGILFTSETNVYAGGGVLIRFP
jgi:hypothetical protein